MTTRHYDAVVVGGRLSATVISALLARRGLRGLLIDQGELSSADGRMLSDLVVPEQGSLAMEIVHSELGVREDLKVKSRSIAPVIQAIFPDQRIDVFADRRAFVADWKRAWKLDAGPFETALAALDEMETQAGAYLANAGELPPTGFFGKRAALSAARKKADLAQTLEASGILSGVPEAMIEILLAPLPFVTHIDGRRPADVTIARFSRAIGRFFRGLSHLEDGRSLREHFLEVAERKGFDVRRSAVESIEPKGKTLNIRVAGARDDLITCDVLVDCSADLSGLDTIPHKLQSKDLALMLQSAKPKGYLHALSLELDADAVPPGMADYLILLNGRKDRSRFDSSDPDAEDRPILLIRRPGSAAGRVELVAVHPVSSVRVHAQRFEELDNVIRARVERLVPFLSSANPTIHPLASRGPRPFLSHPLFEGDLDPIAGICGVPMRTSFKNIFVAGPAVMPGLGVEGEYFTALQAADACDTLLRGSKRPKTLALRAPVTATTST
jgi:hypothetical protein